MRETAIILTVLFFVFCSCSAPGLLLVWLGMAAAALICLDEIHIDWGGYS